MKNKNRLIITFLFFPIAFQMQAQQKYAVLVGINKYYDRPGVQHNGAVLKGCVNDALALKSVLKKRFGFSEDHIQFLADENASKKNVTEALNHTLEKCRPGDAVVFYFSGHGAWMHNLSQDQHEFILKKGYNQAMVMSDLYTDNLDCLFTDAEVKKVFNKFIDKKVVVTAIFDCCFSGMIPAKYDIDEHNPYELDIPVHSTVKSLSFLEFLDAHEDYVDFLADSLNRTQGHIPDSANTKSFNLAAGLFIHDSSPVTRPSERTGSMFLSLAATDDRTEALDLTDETGTPHGAFTAALLHVIRDNPSTLTIAELIRQTAQQVKFQQYPAGMQFYDHARLSENFIGIKPEGFKDHTEVLCTANTGKSIALDAGLLDGLATGNALQDKNKIIYHISSATANSAVALPASGTVSTIKPGERLTVTNSFTKSAPLIKVFFSGSDLSPAAFNKLMTQDILPLAKFTGYKDYENWNKALSHNLCFYGDRLENARQTELSIRLETLNDSFLVFLPIPSAVTNELSALLKRNQNIQVVDNAADAELILYLNYIKASKGKKPHYVFTWANLHGADINLPGMLSFYTGNTSVPDLNMDRQQTKTLAVKIQNILITRIRAHTKQWLNDWPG